MATATLILYLLYEKGYIIEKYLSIVIVVRIATEDSELKVQINPMEYKKKLLNLDRSDLA